MAKSFKEFRDELSDMTLQERLDRAIAMREWLLVENTSKDSVGGDGKNVHRDLEKIEGFITYLQQKVDKSVFRSWQIVIDTNDGRIYR